MSNGREIGTIVGSLVAAYFTGGASYAAFATAAGGAVGGAIGAAIDGPTKIQGQRLDDLKVQFSSYGAGIPILYGTERIAPNVIWSTDKLEIASTSTSGKGGGVENTSYKYYVHMRLLICETPRDGSEVKMVKIFQDGKLIWDASSGIPVGSALASAENPYAGFTLYQGGDDQLPDGREESWTGGPGTAPAYRGVVSVLMTAVECPGGRVPQFSVVTSTTATLGEETLLYSEVPTAGTGAIAWAVIRADQTWHFTQYGNDFDGDYGLSVSSVGNGYATPARSIPVPYGNHYGLAPCPVSGDGEPIALRLRTTPGAAPGVPWYIDRFNLQTGAFSTLYTYTPETPDDVMNPESAGYDSMTGTYAIRGGGANRDGVIALLNEDGVTLSAGIPGSLMGAVTIRNGVAYALSSDGANLMMTSYNAADGSQIATALGPAFSDSSLSWSALHPADGGVYLWIRSAPNYQLYFISSVGATFNWRLISNNVNTTGVEKLGNLATTIYASNNIAIIGPSGEQDGFNRYNVVRFNAVTLVTVKASDVIADQCERSGTTTYDVSGIPDSDTITGYKIANPASARGNIDPLLTCFSLYVVDEDGLTKFKKLSSLTATSSVSYDELGQGEQGSESGEAMPLARTQEVDLPRSVTISYIDPTFDFQVASETEVRQVTDATEDQVLQLPLCISSDQAKRAAQWILFSRWRSQNTRSLNVSRKFSANSPGDGVDVEYPRGTVKLWRLMSVADTGGRCEWTVEPGDAELFTQTAIGAVEYPSQQVAPLPAPLQMVILDIPNLRDEDNTSGPYVALDSVAPVPAVGEIFVGPDGSSPGAQVSQGTVSASAPIGFAETIPAGWSRNLVDETNIFTVSIGDDVFDSCTRDVLLSGGGAAWALGAPGRWEIGSSALGDSLGSGRYILSRHLRGLFGTEHNAGTHQVGDTFVLLRPVGMLDPNTGVGNIGVSLSYTAVAKGRNANTTPSVSYANTGEQLRPLGPVNPRRSMVSNDITVSVDRRSRLSMNNATGNVPLGESVESYTWQFFTDGTYSVLAGSVVTSVSTVTITSAQQTAWGLVPGGTVYFRVAQNSDSVGIGNQLEATL